MHLQKWDLGNRGILVLTMLLLLGLLGGGGVRRRIRRIRPMWPSPRYPTPATPPSQQSLRRPTPLLRGLARRHPDTFIIGVEDVLNINVWKEPEMSRTVPVRPDGMISLPLIGEIEGSGPHSGAIAGPDHDIAEEVSVGPSGDGDGRRGPQPDV